MAATSLSCSHEEEPQGQVRDIGDEETGISWACVLFGAVSFCLLLLVLGGVVVFFAPGARTFHVQDLEVVGDLLNCQEPAYQLHCEHSALTESLNASAMACQQQSAGFYLAILAAWISGMCGIVLLMKARSWHTCAAAGFALGANMCQGLLVALDTSYSIMGAAGDMHDASLTNSSFLICPLGFASLTGFDNFLMRWHSPEQTQPWTRGLWGFVVLLSILWIQALASHGVYRMEGISGVPNCVPLVGALSFQLLLCLLIPFVALAAPDYIRQPVLTTLMIVLAGALAVTVGRILYGLARAERKLRSFSKTARENDGTQEAINALEKTRKTLLVKMVFMSFSVVMSLVVGLLVILPKFVAPSSGRVAEEHILNAASVIGSLDVLSNAFASWVLSNACHSALGKRHWRPLCCPFEGALSPRGAPAVERTLEAGWESKVRDLSMRGISLQSLIHFYGRLGVDLMPHFQASVHTTSDVVRHAIIPATRTEGCAYALAAGGPMKPQKMVTHNWQNLFRDLVAAVIADALQESSFDLIAGLLREDVGILEELLAQRGQLATTYWICAFAVNQHGGICAGNPSNDVDSLTKLPYPLCDCRLPKVFNQTPPLDCHGRSIHCELNKFDDMMWLLAAENPNFAQVVAVDMCFGLFQRAWCVAELAEARRLRLKQRVKLPSRSALAKYQDSLRSLRVEDMKASRPEDVQEILAKIPDRNAFNQSLHRLIFDRDGILAAYRQLDAIHQLEEAGRLLLWGQADRGRGLVWRLWSGRSTDKELQTSGV